MKPQSVRALTTANSPLPSVLGLGIAYGLPLHVGNRIGAAAGERLNVILAVAGASAAGPASRKSGMRPLELPCHLAGSMLFCRSRVQQEDWQRAANQRAKECPSTDL
jgi:hypothetical protein